MSENIRRVVEQGRDPALQLITERGEISLREHAVSLMQQLQPLAAALDQAEDSKLHNASFALQLEKINAPQLTPSAYILQQMEAQQLPFFRLAMAASQQHAKEFRERPLDPARQAFFEQESQLSLQKQQQIEAADDIDFETYLQHYFAQYGAI